jgi:hypothetical protein
MKENAIEDISTPHMTFCPESRSTNRIHLSWSGDLLMKQRSKRSPEKIIGSDEQNHIRAPMPDELFVQLARIARVTDTNLPRLRLGVRLTIDIAWALTERRRVRAEPGVVASLQQAAKTAQALHKALHSLNKGARVWLGACLDEDLDHMNMNPTLAEHEEIAGILAEACANALEAATRRRRRPYRGRPSGAVSNYPFRLFVSRLYRDIREAGGNLTLDKNRRRGTLVMSLRLLSPYLPRRFISEALPYSTMQKLKSNWTKKAP